MKKTVIKHPNGCTEVIRKWESEEEESLAIARGEVPGWGQVRSFPSTARPAQTASASRERARQKQPQEGE